MSLFAWKFWKQQAARPDDVPQLVPAGFSGPPNEADLVEESIHNPNLHREQALVPLSPSKRGRSAGSQPIVDSKTSTSPLTLKPEPSPAQSLLAASGAVEVTATVREKINAIQIDSGSDGEGVENEPVDEDAAPDTAVLSEAEQVAIDALAKFLSRKDHALMVKLPPHLLTPNLRTRLAKLHDNFASRKRKRDDERGEIAGPPSKRTGGGQQHATSTPIKTAGSPMARFALKRRLKLARVFADHILVNGTDGQAFIESEVSLHYHAHELPSTDKLCEAFAACYHFATSLSERSEMDNVRRCFTMIMFSKFMEMMHPRPNPGDQMAPRTRRIGPKMHERAMTFLEITFQTEPNVLAEAKDNITKWSRWGDKLRVLCDKFGEGSVFFLEQHLSADFLENKFFLDGTYAAEAFDNLERLDLKGKGIESRTTELGRNIREFMIRPLRERLDLDGAESD